MTAPVDPAAVRARAESLRQLIAEHGRAVGIVAVTKGFGPDAIEAALGAGLGDLGENYAQSLEAKAEHARAAGLEPRWHFIGQIQRNKVRRIAEWVSLWQTVDRQAAAEEIAKRSPGAAVLVQVNATGEPQKGGCTIAEVDRLVEVSSGVGLEVRGLMTVGPTNGGDPPRWRRHTRQAFETVRDLADRLELSEVSMGMSADLEIALDCGSTMVRVGTGLFGPRSP